MIFQGILFGHYTKLKIPYCFFLALRPRRVALLYYSPHFAQQNSRKFNYTAYLVLVYDYNNYGKSRSWQIMFYEKPSPPSPPQPFHVSGLNMWHLLNKGKCPIL